MRFFKRLSLSLLLSCFVSSCTAPAKNLWPRWQTHQPDSVQAINHQEFQDFLTRYLYQGKDGINLMHYSQVTVPDKAKLAHYLNHLSLTPISLYNRQEQLAYWINLYNALTIQLIITHWPVKSITKLHLSPGFFSIGPWDAPLITVEGQELTLNDIEHRIIRPIWNDARVHYALNCASMSCPQLQGQPFRGKTFESLVTKAAHEYVNSPQGVFVTDKELILSQIYEWYHDDFGTDEQMVLHRIAEFANPPLKNQLLTNKKPIRYHYDWQLNGN
ncbi:MAG: DUF547 domain-containing protein [Methylococcales bacterium]|nr:DUF547 domain-containing protein [Methylococcales bacterium]